MNKASFEDEFQMPLPVTFSCSKYLALVFLLLIRAVRRRHCVGGCAPVNRRRRRGVDGPKYYFLRFTKKFRSILKIFLGTFLVIKALRFADDQC